MEKYNFKSTKTRAALNDIEDIVGSRQKSWDNHFLESYDPYDDTFGDVLQEAKKVEKAEKTLYTIKEGDVLLWTIKQRESYTGENVFAVLYRDDLQGVYDSVKECWDAITEFMFSE
jgi:hypothetical protein